MLRIAMSLLCGVGLYTSIFMLGKQRRSQRGLLAESSVVQTPRASVLGGVPNAAFGIVYYIGMAAGVWLAHGSAEHLALIAAALAAAIMSVYLAFSLLFVTRMPCTYCWTSHIANALLLVGSVALAHAK